MSKDHERCQDKETFNVRDDDDADFVNIVMDRQAILDASSGRVVVFH